MSDTPGAEATTYVELDQPEGEGSRYIELDQPEGEGSRYVELDQPEGEGSRYVELDQPGPEGTVHIELDRPRAEIGDIDRSVSHAAEVAAADRPLEEDAVGDALAAAPLSGGIGAALGHSAEHIAAGEVGGLVLEHSVSVDTTTAGTPADGPAPGDAGAPAGTGGQGTYVGEVDDPGFTGGGASGSVGFAIPATDEDAAGDDLDGFGESGEPLGGGNLGGFDGSAGSSGGDIDVDDAGSQDTVYAPDSGDAGTADSAEDGSDLESGPDSGVDSELDSPVAEPGDFDVPGRPADDLTEAAEAELGG